MIELLMVCIFNCAMEIIIYKSNLTSYSAVNGLALNSIIFMCTLLVLFNINHMYISTLVVAAAALTGQYFYAPNHV